MTDKIEEIRRLIRENNRTYSLHKEARRKLLNAILDRNNQMKPTPGEAWHVIPAPHECKNTVVAAIKLEIGWQLTPDAYAPIEGEDGTFSARYIYPVKRIAEAPTTKEEGEHWAAK